MCNVSHRFTRLDARTLDVQEVRPRRTYVAQSSSVIGARRESRVKKGRE